MWGGGGRIELTLTKFMAIQQAFKPDWYHCMADGEPLPPGSSRKRINKSVDRTLGFLDECLKVHQNSEVKTFIYLTPELIALSSEQQIKQVGYILWRLLEGKVILLKHAMSCQDSTRMDVERLLLLMWVI